MIPSYLARTLRLKIPIASDIGGVDGDLNFEKTESKTTY